MAIRRQTLQESLNSPEDYRHRLEPFTRDESGIKALQSYFTQDNTITRGGMYLLEIINNTITSTNGQKNTRVFRRIPSEIYSGWYEGGPELRKASLICRATDGERPNGSREGEALTQEKGGDYTVEQLRLGSWAERDGSWSDEPEAQLIKAGHRHDPKYDGSESRIFHDKTNDKVYKTTDWTHYETFEKLLDKIAIHNSVFPESRLTVKGYGVRDDATDNTGFVAVLEQPFIEGLREATKEEVEDLLHERGLEKTSGGIWFVSRDGNLALTDLGGGPFEELNEEFGFPLNALLVENDDGSHVVIVVDCDAHLKTFGVNNGNIQRVAMSSLAPDSAGRFDSQAWETVLGPDGRYATDAEKSALYKELRTNGCLSGTVNGNIVKMISPIARKATVGPGKEITYYDDTVCVGPPAAFRKDDCYEIPPLQYDETRVRQIQGEINALLPVSITPDEFLCSARYLGNDLARYREGSPYRKEFKRQLASYGRVEGTVGGYIIQADRDRPGNILVTDPRQARFLVWATSNTDDQGVRFTDANRRDLSQGKTILCGGKAFYLDTDRGRICPEINPTKLKLVIEQNRKNGIRI